MRPTSEPQKLFGSKRSPFMDGWLAGLVTAAMFVFVIKLLAN